MTPVVLSKTSPAGLFIYLLGIGILEHLGSLIFDLFSSLFGISIGILEHFGSLILNLFFSLCLLTRNKIQPPLCQTPENGTILSKQER